MHLELNCNSVVAHFSSLSAVLLLLLSVHVLKGRVDRSIFDS